MRIVTIGGYGYDETTFHAALARAGVDTFADVRQRRGLRGRRYAFLNSTRLQAVLAEAGINYVHIRELAPTQSVRDVQKQQDTEAGVEKRARRHLSRDFVNAYISEVLDGFDVGTFKRTVGPDASVVAIFCVEGSPEACHRSLVAERLSRELGVQVEHLQP